MVSSPSCCIVPITQDYTVCMYVPTYNSVHILVHVSILYRRKRPGNEEFACNPMDYVNILCCEARPLPSPGEPRRLSSGRNRSTISTPSCPAGSGRPHMLAIELKYWVGGDIHSLKQGFS